MEPNIWLILFIILLLFELALPGMMVIWFAGGAMAAWFVARCGGEVLLQVAIFLVVSFVIAMLFRPVLKKWKETPKTKTNIDAIIGKTVYVTQTIDNYEETGVAILNGQEWTARNIEEEQIIPEGAKGIVREISGVKLIIEWVDKFH